MSLLLIGSRSRRMSLTWSFHSHLRLSLIGYHIGQRLLALHYHRLESPASSLTGSSLASAAAKAKPSRRETRLLPVLGWIHTQLWKAAFGKTADSLQKTVDKPDECESEQEGQRWRSSQSDVFEGSHAWKLYLSLESMDSKTFYL